MNDYEGLSDWDKLSRAEELIESGELEEAQKAVDAVATDFGRKYFVQSKIFKAKGWFNEERKQLKKALKAEPDNEEYKKALDDVDKFVEEMKTEQKQKGQMGGAEVCALGCCECCGSGLCQAICDGCT